MATSPPRNTEVPGEGRATALFIIRCVVAVLVVTVAGLFVVQDEHLNSSIWRLIIPFVVALGLLGLVLGLDVLTPGKKLSMLSGVFLGLLAGVLASVATSFVIDLAAQGYDWETRPAITTVKITASILFCYLGVSVVLQTQDDFRLVIPYVEFAKQVRGMRPLLLDTSSLIDARIIDLAETGILQAPLIIPRFVVNELQTLADSEDRSKRSRGRRGLDVVSRLQRAPKLDVSVSEAQAPGKSVDQMLVELARQEQAIILTGDTGLARVARIHSAPVVSLHDLAASMRSSVAAGDTIVVRLLRAGEHPGQAVGYLDDGQMVVAENGADLIGSDAPLTVTGTVQTSGGRLVFARAPSLMDAAHASEHGETAEAPEEAPSVEESPARSVGAEPRGRSRRGARNPRRG